MATLKDVATAAKVSPITVSRVINTPELVKQGTRQRVQKIMAAMQYVPNVAAKNLVSKRSGIIDVFVPESIDLSNPFVMHFIAGISQVLSEHMYSFLILRNRNVEHYCDGYIVTGLLKNEINEFYRYAQERSRLVVLFGHTDIAQVDCIDVDNVAGAKIGTEYLIHKGHRSIGMVNVNENKDYTVDRLEGYKLALQENDLLFEEENIVNAVNDVNGGMVATMRLLNNSRCTAIFCATDTIAIGAAKAIAEAGLKVPDDISLVGFDGLGHQLLAMPRVTTVQQPIYEMGMMLAQAMLDKLDRKTERISRLIAPVLIEEESVVSIL